MIRAFSLYFQLVNTAEQYHRVRMRRRRDREREEAHRFQPESLAAAFASLGARGVSPERLRKALERLSIELVMTAHPTEISRRTVLSKQMIVSHCLEALDNPALSPSDLREVTDRLETNMLLSSENDHRSAILNIHPGAGGTESQDWAEMLMRMYLRWAERNGFKASVTDEQEGEGAGFKNATIEIEGENVFGLMSSEIGGA